MYMNQDNRGSQSIVSVWACCGLGKGFAMAAPTPVHVALKWGLPTKKDCLFLPNAAGPRNTGARIGNFFKFPSSPKTLAVYGFRIAKNISNSRTWHHLINGI